jgi:hypothetical protein
MTSPSTVCGDQRKWRYAQCFPAVADTEEVISWSVGSSMYSARGAPTTVVDEAVVRTPQVAPRVGWASTSCSATPTTITMRAWIAVTTRVAISGVVWR